MTEKQPVSFFIAAAKGPGECSAALATYLSKLQNDFIKSCLQAGELKFKWGLKFHSKVTKYYSSGTTSV